MNPVFWRFPTKPVPLIGYGIIGGAVIEAVVGLIVGFSGPLPDRWR